MKRIELIIRFSFDESSSPAKGEDLLRIIKESIEEDTEQLGYNQEIEIKFIDEEKK